MYIGYEIIMYLSGYFLDPEYSMRGMERSASMGMSPNCKNTTRTKEGEEEIPTQTLLFALNGLLECTKLLFAP